MKTFASAVLLMACSVLCAARTYGPESLARELRDLSGEVEQGQRSAVASSLPDSWTVVSPEGTYTLSSRPLRRLTGPSGNDADARAWLDEVAEQLEGLAKARSRNGDARRDLDQILASREFSGIRPPTPWELFRERLNRAVASFFRWLFAQIAGHPIGQQVLVWTIAAAAIGFLLFLLLRPSGVRTRLTTGQSAMAEVRNWHEWARAARDAASRGDLREAIHAAYWCCVGRLQESGALPSDGVHTPREYIRLSRQRNTSLISLTSRFERVWYAGRPATQEDVRDTLAELEAIGCHLD